MSVSRDRLAPGQSRVSTASAFGRIGFLMAAAVLSIPENPPAKIVARPAIEVPHRLACHVVDPQLGGCLSNSSTTEPQAG